MDDSHRKVRATIARLEWVSSYESIESALMEYLNLETE